MILDSLIFLCGGGIMMFLVYLFRADRCRLSRRGLMAFCAACAALHVLLYIPYALLFGSALVSVSWFELIVWGLFAVPAFWLYPGHGWKTLFLWLVSGSVIAVCVGAGNLLETLVAADSPIPPRLAHVLITVAVSVPVMAGVLAIQRRFTGLYGAGGAGNDGTWRHMAAIAGILFVMVCIAGNVFGLHNTTPLRFLLARLVGRFGDNPDHDKRNNTYKHVRR